MNKSTVTQIRKDLEEALKAVTEKHGISFTLGDIRYSATTLDFKALGVVGGNGNPHEVYEQEVADHGRFYNLRREDCGKTFLFEGRNYVFVGLKTSFRKFPIIAKKVGTNGLIKIDRRYLSTISEQFRK